MPGSSMGPSSRASTGSKKDGRGGCRSLRAHLHMSISELYEIGRRSRNPLSGVSKARRAGAGLVRLLDDDEDAVGSGKRDSSSDDEGQSSRLNAVAGGGGGVAAKCMICREHTSKYNCPSCNAAYCSLACYQSTRHASCSQPFLKKTLQAELGEKGVASNVDDGERKAMMDVLRRMNAMGESEEEGWRAGVDDKDSKGDDGDDDAVDLTSVDLDGASVEQLFSLLSTEERARFRDAIEEQDPAQGRARSLFDRLVQQQDPGDAQGPWWKAGHAIDQQDSAFSAAVTSLSSRQAKAAKTARLEYNILAVLLTYAYIVRHLDVRSLKEIQKSMNVSDGNSAAEKDDDDMPPLEPVDQLGEQERALDSDDEKSAMRDVVKLLLRQLVPFLDASGDASKTILESAEDVSLWFAARLSPDAASELAKMLCFLYDDVQTLATPPRLVDMSDSIAADYALVALADLQSFTSLSGQRKLIFFAAYWTRLSIDARHAIAGEVNGEAKRMQVEVERAEDEERYRAANEAITHQGVLVSDSL